jgi:dimethylglycine dehydrogenase
VGEIGDADAIGNEPLFKDGEMVGRATAGGYGWRVGKSLALGFVKPELAAEGTELEIDVLGELKPARVIAESPYDPDNEKLRG